MQIEFPCGLSVAERESESERSPDGSSTWLSYNGSIDRAIIHSSPRMDRAYDVRDLRAADADATLEASDFSIGGSSAPRPPPPPSTLPSRTLFSSPSPLLVSHSYVSLSSSHRRGVLFRMRLLNRNQLTSLRGVWRLVLTLEHTVAFISFPLRRLISF